MIQDRFKTTIEATFGFTLNKNQWKDINRLLYEISMRDNRSAQDIITSVRNTPGIQKAGDRNKFFALKNALITLRFPLTSEKMKIDTKKVFLPELKKTLTGSSVHPQKKFIPEAIFVEKSAQNSYLAKRFRQIFPRVPLHRLAYCGEYIKKHPFTLADLKKPLVFIVKERWDFIKPCPCTKGHLGCNYWIFNLGMGCPYDCSYCFLQQYSNFPGIILPANLDDFFTRFDTFYRKVKRPIRIGTGEFCDSLALDEITGYSTQLIEFFKDKPVFFELKTKSAAIDNLLKVEGAENIIISWSLNPPTHIESEELCTASLKKRLAAAKKVQEKGYSLGFHFDPLIYSHDWQKQYQEVLKKLYAYCVPPFKWISLGTLRGTRQLKNVTEKRFPASRIFYGELFIGEDKKLRYPKFLRKEMYGKLKKWIRKYDSKTPLYLCMEAPDIWKGFNASCTNAISIEKQLTGAAGRPSLKGKLA